MSLTLVYSNFPCPAPAYLIILQTERWIGIPSVWGPFMFCSFGSHECYHRSLDSAISTTWVNMNVLHDTPLWGRIARKAHKKNWALLIRIISLWECNLNLTHLWWDLSDLEFLGKNIHAAVCCTEVGQLMHQLELLTAYRSVDRYSLNGVVLILFWRLLF